jgi:hypothetical protein
MTKRLTEEEYLRLAEPGRVSNHFNSRTPLRTSTRKARLFLCACCRRVWNWLGSDANRAADGLLRIKDLHPYHDATSSVPVPLRRSPHALADPAGDASWPFPWPVCYNGCLGAVWLAGYHWAGPDVARQEALIQAELAFQCVLIRDLLGNPFRPVSINPAWQTATVVSLAQAAYDNRILPAGTLEPARLAILADALEEAGCASADILHHLRQPGVHVRGCWVIDRLLAKE